MVLKIFVYQTYTSSSSDNIRSFYVMFVQFRTKMHYQNNISRVVFRGNFIVGNQHTSGTGFAKRLTDFLRAGAMNRIQSIFPTMRLVGRSSNGQETNSIHQPKL